MWADALPNLLIGLREGLEAGLVVSILLAALGKPRRASSTPIWFGVGAAIVLALSFGAVLTFYKSVLSTTGQEGLGGSLSVLAVFLVTWMIFWMRRTARGLSAELKEKVNTALTVSTSALALTAFLAVGREGIETALFLWTAAQASGTTTGPLIGAALGIACAVVLCVLLYRRAVKIRLDKFFNRTGILLIVIAAGVLSYGLGDLQDAGWLPGHLWVAFNLSGTFNDGSWYVSLLRGITNLTLSMTWLQVVAYLCYLGVVLTMFVQAGRRSTAAAGAPPEQAPKPKRQWSPRTITSAAAAALVVPPVVAGGLIALAPGQASAAQTIEVTAKTCASSWSAATAGTQTFTVENTSSDAAEINLDETSSQGIVAEIETLGPGTKQTMSATLSAGTSYTWRCFLSGAPTIESSSITAAGKSTVKSPAAVKQVTVAELRPAFREYTTYVRGKLTTLESQAQALVADVKAGNLAKARTDWLPADLTWEEVGEEPYGSFGDYGIEIDAGAQRWTYGVNDPRWTGLHRLEYGLWHGQSAATLLPVARTLATDVAQLKAKLPQLNVDPTDLPVRAHEVLEDALRDQLTSQLDFGSGDGYAETLADVQVDRVVVGELANLISERAPHLVSTAYSELNQLQQALLATKSGGQWVSVADTPLAKRQPVDAAIDSALETLSDVPDLLETAAH